MDSAEDKLFASVHNVIYKATSQAFKQYQNAVGKHQSLKEDSPGRCKHTLIYAFTRTNVDSEALVKRLRLLCSPVVRGYCLLFKTWGKHRYQAKF